MKNGAGVHCARAVHVQVFCTCCYFAAPTGQTVRAADAKLAGHMYATPAYMYLWLPILSDAGCARQDRKSLFERGPPVLGNFELLTPNLVHLWNSMSLIRWYMSFRDRVHSARVLCICIGTFTFGKLWASDAKLGILIQFNECYSVVHDKGCYSALQRAICESPCTCNARAICKSPDFGKF